MKVFRLLLSKDVLNEAIYGLLSIPVVHALVIVPLIEIDLLWVAFLLHAVFLRPTAEGV